MFTFLPSKPKKIQHALEERRRREFNALANGGGSKVDLNLLIAYGSDSGHAAGVAEALANRAGTHAPNVKTFLSWINFFCTKKCLEASGCGEVRTCEANDVKIEDLENEKTVLFILATAGQGEDCANAKKFTAALMARKSKLPSSLRVAVFGLGDSNYWGKVVFYFFCSTLLACVLFFFWLFSNADTDIAQ